MFSGGKRTNQGAVRTRQLQKTCSNVSITILCGLVTILVLRGTTSLNNLVAYSTEHLIKEKYQVLVMDNEDKKEFISPSPTLMSRKPTVLLVTSSPPEPCGNAIADYYSLKEIKNKIDYGRIHEIEIFYNMAVLEEGLTISWSKMSLIKQLMLSHPEVEWFWWMDSNALFTNLSFEVPFFTYEDYNMVVVHDQKSVNTGIFLIRNCQWSMDLLNAWRQIRGEGTVDDQSALADLFATDEKHRWMNKILIDKSSYAHWEGLIGKYQSGFGDEMWPFVTHFVGCEICPGSNGDNDLAQRCLEGMERAFNFADNQILNFYGFRHKGLVSTNVKRIRNETDMPLVDLCLFDIRRN